MRRRGRLARAERRAAKAEAEVEECLGDLLALRLAAEAAEQRLRIIHDELDQARRVLMCIGLMVDEDRVVKAFTDAARAEVQTIQAVDLTDHVSA